MQVILDLTINLILKASLVLKVHMQGLGQCKHRGYMIRYIDSSPGPTQDIMHFQDTGVIMTHPKNGLLVSSGGGKTKEDIYC